jgi:hypothetical protein
MQNAAVEVRQTRKETGRCVMELFPIVAVLLMLFMLSPWMDSDGGEGGFLGFMIALAFLCWLTSLFLQSAGSLMGEFISEVAGG